MHFDADYLRKERGEQISYAATSLKKTTELQN